MGSNVILSESVVSGNVFSVIHPCNRSGTLEECLRNPPASKWIGSRTRRWIEVSFALAVLVLSAAPMLILAACIRLTSRGRALYSQERVGLRGCRFTIYKLRSMRDGAGNHHGQSLTKAGDSRVTMLGRFMRKFKIDELPQFYNILRGDMSLVGPRPKLPQYAVLFNSAYRPGITGAATIAFRHEGELMRGVDEAELDEFYAQNIKPVKAHLDACYMCRATPSSDLRIVTDTLFSCLKPAGTRVDSPAIPAVTVLPVPGSQRAAL